MIQKVRRVNLGGQMRKNENIKKNRLDKHLTSQEHTIGKQNYQEPEIEAELNFELFEFTIIYSK